MFVPAIMGLVQNEIFSFCCQRDRLRAKSMFLFTPSHDTTENVVLLLICRKKGRNNPISLKVSQIVL